MSSAPTSSLPWSSDMNTPFISAVAHPIGRTEPALFFAFQDDQLLVYLDGDIARLPQLGDFVADLDRQFSGGDQDQCAG